MAPGTYTGIVYFNSTTLGANTSTTQNVTLHVIATATTDKFSCASPNATVPWSNATGNIVVNITCTTGGQSVSFSTLLSALSVNGGAQTLTNSASNTFWSISPANGIAYSWGTPVAVTVPATTLQNLAYGSSVTGQVTFTPINGDPAVSIPVNINITPGTPTVTSYAPSELPKDTATDHTVVITGTNFVSGTTIARAYAAGATACSAVSGSTLNTDSTLIDPGHINVVNSGTMILTLDHSAFLSATTANLCIQVENPPASPWAPAASGSFPALEVTTNPIIYSITDAGSFTEPPAGTNQAVSPYEIISIFGANFDPANGVAVQPSTSLATAPFEFVNSMQNSNNQTVHVTFCKGNTTTSCTPTGTFGTGTFLANAPLIFVSNTQINAIVPDAVSTALGTNAANYGANVLVTVATNSNDSGNLFLLNTQPAHPGLFTPGGSGQGQAAVLVGANATLNSASNPVTKSGTVAAPGTSAYFSIWLTGMGEALAGSNQNTSVVSASTAYPGLCVTPAAWENTISGVSGNQPSSANDALGIAAPGYVTGTTYTSFDGTIFLSNAFYTNALPPCLAISAATTTGSTAATGIGYVASSALVNTGVAVTIGGLVVPPADITYAGFAGGSVAGLYQIDVTLPTAFSYTGATNSVTVGGSTGTQEPLVVYLVPSTGTTVFQSQPGAYIYVN
jgi:uncharacterized protein (TIGR03437 family)